MKKITVKKANWKAEGSIAMYDIINQLCPATSQRSRLFKLEDNETVVERWVFSDNLPIRFYEFTIQKITATKVFIQASELTGIFAKHLLIK